MKKNDVYNISMYKSLLETQNTKLNYEIIVEVMDADRLFNLREKFDSFCFIVENIKKTHGFMLFANNETKVIM